MNEDKMRQQECETYIDSAICEKSQEERIKELEEAVSWLAIELAGVSCDAAILTTFEEVFRNEQIVKLIKTMPTLESTLEEILS